MTEYVTCPRCGNDTVPEPPASTYHTSDTVDACGCADRDDRWDE